MGACRSQGEPRPPELDRQVILYDCAKHIVPAKGKQIELKDAEEAQRKKTEENERMEEERRKEAQANGATAQKAGDAANSVADDRLKEAEDAMKQKMEEDAKMEQERYAAAEAQDAARNKEHEEAIPPVPEQEDVPKNGAGIPLPKVEEKASKKGPKQ